MECQIRGCKAKTGASDVICPEHWLDAQQKNRRPLIERVGENQYKLVGWQEVRPGQPSRNLPL